MRKFLSVLLSLAMLMSMLVVPVAAEDEASGTSGAASAECHLLAGISAYEVMEGETVTVTLHSEAMTVKTFSGGLSFDSDALTCIGISTGSGYDRMADGALMTQLSTTWEANANGNVGLSVVRTAEETYDAQELLTVTFTAAAPAESGTYIGVYEDSDGMDGFAGEGAGLTLYIRTGGMPHEHVTLEFTIAESAANGAVIDVSLRVDECLDTDDEDVACSATPCTLTVTGGSEPVQITGVTLEGEGLTTTEDGKYALTIIEGGEAALTAKVEPAAASQTVTWSADSADITVTDGKITTTSGTTGTFTVTAAAGDKSAACIVTVTHGDLKPAAATPATCEGNGQKAHWFCSTCNNRYTDSAGTQKATEEELTDPMKGHDYGALIPEAPAKCSHAGMAAHYTCSRCGDFFDAEKNKKAEKDLLLPATGAHDWIVTSYVWADDYTSCTGTAKCRVCSTVKSAAATDIQKVVTTTATCQVEGEETYTAAFADTTFETQVKTVSTGKAAHTLTGTDAVEPTCTTDGNYAYWTCSVCDGVFGDAEGTTETTVAAAKRNALGHSYGQPVWSWADDGKNATVKLTCTREGCGHSEMPTVTVSGDTLTPATCTAKGTTRYTAAATLDGETYNDTKDVQDIPMADHRPLKTGAKEPTCTETGNYEYWTCSACGGVFEDEQCTTSTSVANRTRNALGHDFESPSWEKNAGGHWHKCSRCEETDGVKRHEYAEDDCTIAADCEVCGYHKDAREHQWGTISYIWTKTESGYDCTGTVKCESCGKPESETGSVHVDYRGATCTEDGVINYKATFEQAPFTQAVKSDTISALGHTMTKTDAVAATCTETGISAYWTCGRCGKFFSDEQGRKEIAENGWITKALGHSYGQPVWTWADDGKTAEVKIVCANDKNHVRTDKASLAAGTISSTVAVKPTCTAMGTTRYNAAVSLEGKAYSNTKDVQDIPMEAHKLVKTEAKAATCVETGNNAYWICSVCKGVFKDEQGKTKTTVTAETLAVDPANHVGGTVQRDAVAETCSVSGREADTYCKSCGVLLQRGAVIPATGRHTYGSDGRCTVCGNKNPAEGIKTDDIKASDTVSGKPVSEDNQGRIVTDGSGLVARTEGPADESKVEDIKAALNDGSISVLVKDSPETIPAAEDGGLQALEAMASGETDAQRKQALERLVKMFRTMSSSRRNVQAQVVYNTALKLYDDGGTEVADLMQIPSGMRVSMAISEAMYRSLKNKELCILRGSTNAAGETVAEELSAVLGGSEGSRVVTFTTDKAGALMLVAYESTSNGGGHGGGSGTYTAPTTGDAGVTVWCMVLGVSALLGTALLTKKRRQA